MRLSLLNFTKHPETAAQVLLQTVSPTESINFISLGQDLFIDGGYNLGQVAMPTLITSR